MAEKKYIIDNAELMAEWDWERNTDFDPLQLTIGSNIKAWWKCSKGHEWQATILHRNNGMRCPYCAGRYAVKGENDLQTVNPTLAKEWNYEINNGLTPMDVLPNSDKKVWWKCSKGHEWQAIIGNRNKGQGCPYCAGRKVLKDYNDLQTVNPTVASEWNYEKNNGLTPAEVMPNSNKKAWWKCKKGHEWKATINSRNNGTGCPFCSGKSIIVGYNDLQTINPTLSKEWHYEKNNGLTPSDVMPKSGKKVWWKCKKGHEWQARIADRNNGRGCPICNSEQNTSFPEYAIVFYLKKYGIEAIHTYKEKGFELDVYIPIKKVAIEYDGYYWHKNKSEKDLEKNLACQKEGIKLYRIREGLSSLNDSSIDYIVQRNGEDLSKVLKAVLYEIIGILVDIDIERDTIAIEHLREHMEKENSFLFSNQVLVSEWNHEKNGKLKPEYFTANSKKKVWWKCSKGHEWQATIGSRNIGRGCPYCAGKKVLKGYNDLQTINPALATEWHYEKNKGLTPIDVTASSGQKVWWRCNKGHEWQAMINSRNRGAGCPYCSSKYVISGQSDLQTVNPDLAKEWNYEKNDGLAPSNVLPNSKKKVWWKCSCGHEWEAVICNRHKGSGCPYCSGQKVLKGYNDLQTINPGLSKEWHYEKNNDLRPTNVTANSGQKVWWRCNKGHEWKAVIQNRTNGRGCPYCSGLYVVSNKSDLQTVNPSLASEWNYEKNNGLAPMDVTSNSHKKVWWKCINGHEWQARIDSRNNGNGCPICRKNKSSGE